jgi:polysaccharide biosynthesis protein PelB
VFANRPHFNRPRIAPNWLVYLLAGVVLASLWFLHPRDGLKSRMTSTDAPSDLSIAYLEAWLRVQPDNAEMLSVLGTQYVRTGRNEEASRIADRMDAMPGDAQHRAALMLRLTVRTREAFAFPENDPRRDAALLRLRTQLEKAAALQWPTDDLLMLAQSAAAVNAQQLAGQLYARLAAQDPSQAERWNREVVRFAMYGGDYRGAANGWFRLQASAASFDTQRKYFIAGIRALQSGNLLDEALVAANQHGRAFANDRATLVVLLNLARAAHRPELVDRYAKALAGYAQAQPEAHDGVQLASYQYTYMDAPSAPARGRLPREFSVRVVRDTRDVPGYRDFQRDAHIVRVAAKKVAMSASTAYPPGTPDDMPNLLYQSFLESNDLPNAQRVATEQVDAHPHSAVWTRRLAQIAEWNNAAPLALKMWQAFAESTGDFEGWRNVMRLAPMLHDDNAYVKALTQASNAAPGDLKLIDSVVAAYERLGRPDDALAFLKTRDRGETAQDVQWRIGQLAERAGRDDEALATYRKLSQRDPANTRYALLASSLQYKHGEYQAALDTLMATRHKVKKDDIAFWRNVAQLARLLQRDDVSNDAYRNMLASRQMTSEDLAAMTYFYNAYPVDAARTAELQFKGDRSGRALSSSIHYYTDAEQYDRAGTLLASLSPDEITTAETDPEFLRVRAEYYRQTDHPLDALADLQHAVAKPGATLETRAALLWTLVDYGSDAQLGEAMAPWRDTQAKEPVLWGPLAAAYMRQNKPEAALKYLRLQSASMSRDPLWQLTFAEAQEMSGHVDRARSIRRSVWRQLKLEEASVQDKPIDLQARPARDNDAREQLLARRVTLASMFENADVSKAFLNDLLKSDGGRNEHVEARRTLLGDTAGLPPVQNVAAKSDQADEPQLTSAVARDVALAWAVSREANPLAKRWLARQYASTLVQPSEQLIAIALADKDKPEMERLLDKQGARLPIYNRIDATVAVDRPGAAEDLSFNGLEGAPDDAELHQRLVETAMNWPQSLDATVTSYVEHPLDYIEQTLAGSIKYGDRYMFGIKGTQRFQHSTDATQLVNVPSVDREVDAFARRQTADTAYQFTIGRREALDGVTPVQVAAEFGRDSTLSLQFTAGYDQIARESQALMVGGVKDNVVGTVTYRVTPHLYATGTVEADRFYSQARNYLGSGVLSSGEVGYRIRTSYPDYTVRFIAAHGGYSASGAPDALISRLIPVPAGPVDAGTFVPKSYSQYGMFFGFGNDLIEQYTHAWRPFMDVGMLHDSNQGWGPEVSLGLAGTVFGGDHAVAYFSHQRVSRIGTPVTQIGARYKWYF